MNENNENTNTTTATEENTGAVETNSKTYTEEEVMRLLQSESDKRVSQALATAQKKFDKQLSLSKLDGSEREKAEKDAEIADLKEKLARFEVERNKSELKSVLSARGLSAEFADIILINDDIEASQSNIDKLDKLFKAAVKAEVERRLAGNAPKGNSRTTAELTKEQARKMRIDELNELALKQPELFNKLFN